MKNYNVDKSEAEWKQELGLERYKILREKGTEFPHSGKYNLAFDKGTYCCGACGEPLFESDSKFQSSCGWPSFDESIPGKVEYIKDTTHGMLRTEFFVRTAEAIWDTFLMMVLPKPDSVIV